MSAILQRGGAVAGLAAAFFALSVSTVHAQGALDFNERSFQTFQCGSKASLQTQLKSAHDGATIFPGGEACEGPFVISDKDVNLRGFGSSRSTLTAAPGSSCVLTIEFARVKISRIDIDATGADYGICIGNGASVNMFEDVEIRNANSIGVFVQSGGSVEIVTSRIMNSLGIGLGVVSGAHATVQHSEIRDNGFDGVHVVGSATAALAGNDITGNEGAGVFSNVNSTVFLNDSGVIEENRFGVSCGLSGALVVGAVQDFGGGNPGDENHDDDVNLTPGCHVVNNASDPSFP